MGKWRFDPKFNSLMPEPGSRHLAEISISPWPWENLATGEITIPRDTLTCARTKKCGRKIDVDPGQLRDAFVRAARAGARAVTLPRPVPPDITVKEWEQKYRPSLSGQ